MRLTLTNVILSFPELFTAEKFDAASKHALFSSSFLIDQTTKEGKATLKLVQDAIPAMLLAKFGKGKVPAKATKPENLCYGDYDYAEEGDEDRFINVRSNSRKRPAVIDRDRSPLVEEDGKIYAGAKVNAIIELWVQDNSYGKKVNAEVKAVQFVDHGDRLGGGSSPMSEGDLEDGFDDLDGDDALS